MIPTLSKGRFATSISAFFSLIFFKADILSSLTPLQMLVGISPAHMRELGLMDLKPRTGRNVAAPWFTTKIPLKVAGGRTPN
ncbi:hypothetical protein HD806DRAFT_212709 [Xylariaceae sp. AK1471]|nr:hypothetical protein HD806DRAFT_212709 [Xylariaceae sp. AK1471]